MKFNEQIKQIRLKKNWTQKAVADALGTSHQNYQRFESGTINTSIEMAEKLCKALDCEFVFSIVEK